VPVPRLKRLRRRLRAALLRAVFAVLGLLPLRPALALGRFLGWLAFHLVRGERRRAEANLRLAYPGADDAFVTGTVRQMFVNLGEHAMETVCIRRVDRRLPGWVRFEAADRAILDRALAAGKGAIVLSGHVGNWELAARFLAREGYEVVAIGRESHDPGLQRLIDDLRASGGVRILHRGHRLTPVKMLRQFQKGGSLFLLVDQDTDVPSVFVPFFGMPAKTPRAPADLCRRTGAALVAGFLHRDGPGKGHRLVFHELEVAHTDDAEADALATTTRINEVYEEEIRGAPAEWVWFHPRWRSKPPVEDTAEAPAASEAAAD
jgi:KDO2-lipid IV(A) lauroyltransferase